MDTAYTIFPIAGSIVFSLGLYWIEYKICEKFDFPKEKKNSTDFFRSKPLFIAGLVMFLLLPLEYFAVFSGYLWAGFFLFPCMTQGLILTLLSYNHEQVGSTYKGEWATKTEGKNNES